MCNPRRVEITLTRQVRESWDREVERAAEVSGSVSGEARIRQPLDASMGGPALMALQSLLTNGFEGWIEQEDGCFRHDVEGGYVLYDPDRHELEIVALETAEIHESGKARERITGTYQGEIESKGEGQYYDDGYGGLTEDAARAEAGKNAESGLDQALRQRLDAEADAEEARREQALRRQAEQDARQRLSQRAESLEHELRQRARERLQEVGIRGRQAFHQLMALAYRDALVGLARRRGVALEDIVAREDGQYLEIDFVLP